MTKFLGIVDYPPTPPIVAAPKNLDTNGINGKCSKFSEMAKNGANKFLECLTPLPLEKCFRLSHIVMVKNKKKKISYKQTGRSPNRKTESQEFNLT